MQIVGGLYREICMIPEWDEEFGSGGRAAAAVSKLSPGSVLHTYVSDSNSPGIEHLEGLGITLQGQTSNTRIAFSYFHPLSQPYIEPPYDQIERQPPLQVSGDIVLCFGFLEGDAIVEAKRAVYDPQTSSSPQAFGANGSRADELAIVLNVLELRIISGEYDLALAADRIMQEQNASVIIVKAGAQGATVFERGVEQTHVPAYRSSSVFKIGTGDVFSAIFSFYWAEAKMSAHYAANLASRSVARYCSTRQLPVPSGSTSDLVPVGASPPGPISLEGEVNTIGGRYVLEEARFRLRELGATVISYALDGTDRDAILQEPTTVLIIAPVLTPNILARGQRAHNEGLSVVVLAEDEVDPVFAALAGPNFTITDDFVSALYFAFWAAIPKNSPGST